MSGYFSEENCRLDEFEKICAQELDADLCPHALMIKNNIPIYDAQELKLDDALSRKAIMAEWAQNLREGSGIVIIKNAQTDLEAIDAASSIFDIVLNEEYQSTGGAGDHFAKAAPMAGSGIHYKSSAINHLRFSRVIIIQLPLTRLPKAGLDLAIK